MKQRQCKTAAPRAALGRRLLSLLCAGTLAAFALFPAAVQAAPSPGQAPRLSNLILDKVYELQPVGSYPAGAEPNDTGFAPEVTEYTGTAYRSVDKVQVYPFAESPTAQVTVNGQPLGEKGCVEMDVAKLGQHPVEVKVTDGGASSLYKVTVTKTDTDYRGRRPIVDNKTILGALSVKTDLEGADKLIEVLKKEHMVVLPESRQADGSYVETDESYWSVPGSLLPDNTGSPGPVTLFTVDLGDVYSVSRIRAAFGPSNLGLGGNKARISVSTDGKTWQTPVEKGNMNTGVQFHQNVTRYEFGVSYDARYIRFEVTHWQYPNKDLRLYQFMVFYDSGKVPEKQPAPDGAALPFQHEERHQYLASGQATVVERGLPMLGWTPSGGYGRGTPTVEEAKQFGYDGPLFYDPDFANPAYMLYNPNSLWGIAKAPFGGNNMASAGDPRDFIPASMKDYIRNAVSFCFGDEGGYSRDEAEAFGRWFDWTRRHYPGVILHTNQFPNQWGENNVKEYLRIAQPDMLTWDDYYGDSSWANPSSINLSDPGIQKNAARQLLRLNTWESYRKLAWGGIDGTGAKPILFGQYLDAFAFNHSQSNKNLIVNTSILSGMKWLNFFRVEYQFDRSYLWDEDGTPTRGLLEWGQLIDRVHAIDDQLTRLNSDWIMCKVGQIGSADAASPNGFRRGSFDDEASAAKNREFGLAGLEVQNLSSAHGGQTGDVVLGYFKPLPGLYESEIAQYFAGATAPRAFMVMNGLVAGTAERYNQFDIAAREAGSSANTRQQITLTADPAFVQAGLTLYEVDKDNGGKLKEVKLDQNGRFTVVLGGGEANLYFWNTNTTASASSQAEGAYASFAFDQNPETFWQPAQTAGSYTLENAVSGTFDKVTVTEKGSAIRTMALEYKGADGQWKELGQAESQEGVWSCSFAPVQAAALRLVITAEGLPAVYEVQTGLSASDPSQVNSLTVNDNTLGTGLFRFSYDGLWSYRETESNAGAVSGQYPLENDGHFSNWSGAQATFTFYGNKVELLLRKDQAPYIQAAITDEGAEPQWKTGSGASLVFDGLEQGVHTLTIRKTEAKQAGIDGAKVSWNGALPEGIVQSASQGPAAVQEYLDQRTTDPALPNHFSYQPAEVNAKEMGADNAGFETDPDEANGWVQHLQNAQYQNLGFTRTQMEGASYTVDFHGTGLQLYAGVTPMGDANAQDLYGRLVFTLDGQEVEPEALDIQALDGNGKVSARMWRVAVPGAEKNAPHTLQVTVTGGYCRVDYAVVERMWENEPSQDALTVSVSAGENGDAHLLTPAQVAPGGSAVVQVTPNPGYQVQRVLVNDVSRSLPADGRLVLTDIQTNTDVQVFFAPACYPVELKPGEGGSLAPSVLYAAAGETVTVTAKPFAGYALRTDSLQAATAAGQPLSLTFTEDGSASFVMPGEAVTVTAVFDKTAAPSPSPSPSPTPSASPAPTATPAPGQSPAPSATPAPTAAPAPGQSPAPVQPSTPGKTPAGGTAPATGDLPLVAALATVMAAGGFGALLLRRRRR